MTDSSTVLNVVGTGLESVAVLSAAAQAYLFGFPTGDAAVAPNDKRRGEKLAEWLARRAKAGKQSADAWRFLPWARYAAVANGVFFLSVAGLITAVAVRPFGGNGDGILIVVSTVLGLIMLAAFGDVIINGVLARLLLLTIRHLGFALAGASLVFGVGVIVQLVAASIAL